MSSVILLVHESYFKIQDKKNHHVKIEYRALYESCAPFEVLTVERSDAWNDKVLDTWYKYAMALRPPRIDLQW